MDRPVLIGMWNYGATTTVGLRSVHDIYITYTTGSYRMYMYYPRTV